MNNNCNRLHKSTNFLRVATGDFELEDCWMKGQIEDELQFLGKNTQCRPVDSAEEAEEGNFSEDEFFRTSKNEQKLFLH